VREALVMWERLQKAAFGLADKNRRFEPLEPLLAEQALDQARVRYLNEVIEFNKSQFRLYWALGQPPQCALPKAVPLHLDMPVAPPPYTPPTEHSRVPRPEQLPVPRPLDEQKR
jgi:hypothetical protein